MPYNSFYQTYFQKTNWIAIFFCLTHTVFCFLQEDLTKVWIIFMTSALQKGWSGTMIENCWTWHTGKKKQKNYVCSKQFHFENPSIPTRRQCCCRRHYCCTQKKKCFVYTVLNYFHSAFDNVCANMSFYCFVWNVFNLLPCCMFYRKRLFVQTHFTKKGMNAVIYRDREPQMD